MMVPGSGYQVEPEPIAFEEGAYEVNFPSLWENTEMIGLRGGKVYIFPEGFRCFSPWSPWPVDFATENKKYIMAGSKKTLISCNRGEKRNRRTGLPKHTPSDLLFPSGPFAT